MYIRNNSEIDLTNLTVANNNAGLYGGGMYLRDDCTITLSNSIIWSNSSSQIHFRSEGEEVEFNVSYSIIENNQDGIATNDNGSLNWLEGNLDLNHIFVQVQQETILSEKILQSLMEALMAGLLDV